MIFLQLNPVSKPEAILEIVFILAAAALLGYLLSLLLMGSQLRLLKRQIEQRQTDLRECKYLLIYEPSFEDAPIIRKPVTSNYVVSEPALVNPDDLKVIEGVGPKIEEILNKNGISTYAELANTSPFRVSAILKSAGPRFQIHDPSTWPQQAALAKNGKWDELHDMKIKLISGK